MTYFGFSVVHIVCLVLQLYMSCMSHKQMSRQLKTLLKSRKRRAQIIGLVCQK